MKQHRSLSSRFRLFSQRMAQEMSQNGRKTAVMPRNIAARFSDVGLLSLFFSSAVQRANRIA